MNSLSPTFPIFLCVDFSCSSRLYELVTLLTIYLISLTSITGENGKMCSPSRSQCPAQKWPHPAAAVWGCGGWLGLWLFAASDHLTAVSPYHLPACHISAHGKKKTNKTMRGHSCVTIDGQNYTKYGSKHSSQLTNFLKSIL